MSLTYESKTAEFSKVLPNEMLERYRNCCHAVLSETKPPKQVLFECRKVGFTLNDCRSACALTILKHLHSKNILSQSLSKIQPAKRLEDIFEYLFFIVP